MIWLAQTPEGVVVVHPVRNSSRASNPAGTVLGSNPATGGAAGQRGIVSNGVNGRTPHQGRGFYICPDIVCLNRAKKKNKGVGFLETMDFRYPTAKGVFDRGGWE